jgi:hypothetical protein
VHRTWLASKGTTYRKIQPRQVHRTWLASKGTTYRKIQPLRMSQKCGAPEILDALVATAAVPNMITAYPTGGATTML